MQLGIVIYSNDAETVWNAFRLGNFALHKDDNVKIFLLGKGVECESLDTKDFKVSTEIANFVARGGEILACGTCLKIRQSEGSELCPFSSMNDLHRLIKTCDKIVSF
jgi:uncharacterized protein involved in oxidation of intracellular sulfur